ncbi:MAG: hypothetical protein LKCHEGNO_01530 [Burkholderiaceae bacterium]|nr:hypothetical protein [Burkholderiaceae bacterium]
MRVCKIGIYWRTLRHLKARQIVGRLKLKLPAPRPDLRTAPSVRPRAGCWIAPARREQSLFGDGRMRFLHAEEHLDVVGWDNPSLARLWRYNQHYFDDLNAHGASERLALQRSLVHQWIEQNPPGKGTGWEPYPVSLRIVNWIKWALGGKPLEASWLDSLAVQARWLSRHVEHHLLGNHLIANAKALIFVGLYFDGEEANEWLTYGLSILGRELDEQILADGGHFERSPMYHALALEDLLDLSNVIGALASPDSIARRALSRVVAPLPAMLQWLRAMTHPDGTLGLFNDCAQGVAPDQSELERYAAALDIVAPNSGQDRMQHLRESGYVRIECGPAIALLDLAPIGPDYLPGHAHADTLSFELSLDGARLIVNGGTSRYGEGTERLYERSTAAHSTVEIAGRNSSEVWSGFRVGRRARPSAPQVRITGDSVEITCAHDGYTFLPGTPWHRRRWFFSPATLEVHDEVSNGALPSLARFIIAPQLQLRTAGARRFELYDSGRCLATIDVPMGRAWVAATRHAPRFGVVLPTSCLTVALDCGRAITRFTWHARPVPY